MGVPSRSVDPREHNWDQPPTHSHRNLDPRSPGLPRPASQAPPSMGFSRQQYWSAVPLPSLDEAAEVSKGQVERIFGLYPEATVPLAISAPVNVTSCRCPSWHLRSSRYLFQ